MLWVCGQPGDASDLPHHCRLLPGTSLCSRQLGTQREKSGPWQPAVSSQARTEAKHTRREKIMGGPRGKADQDLGECRWVPKGQCVLSK